MASDPILMSGGAEPILARATIHLPDGIFPGGWYWIDPDSPDVQVYIQCGYLVPDTEPDETPAVKAQETAQQPEPVQVKADDEESYDGHTEDYSASLDEVDDDE